jgi:hypothetical protein
MAYDIGAWKDFAVAQAGVAGVLLGLVFVALSINLKEIVATSLLTNRALEAVVLFVTILFSASLLLVPGATRRGFGLELLALSVGSLALVALLQRGANQSPSSTFARRQRRVLGLAAPGLSFVAAVSLLGGAGGGLYWWLVAVFVGYLAALASAWVLLVEILR